MKILITGSKGQLGSEIMKCYERGCTELGTPSVLSKTNEVTGVDVDELDITDLGMVLSFLKSGNYDLVINCAAFTNVDGCEVKKDEAFRVNAIGPRNLAIACERNNCKLIHISTDYVFPGDGSKPYMECDLTNPRSSYGHTKLMGEQYVRDFCSRYFIVRTAWLYGYQGKNFVKTIMNAARKLGHLTVVNDQIGNPTNAADLAHHIIKLADTEEYGIYHATGTGECSWFDFACAIVSEAGIKAQVDPCSSEEYALAHPASAVRPKYSSLDNQMLRATVGDEFRTWREALSCFMKNYAE